MKPIGQLKKLFEDSPYTGLNVRQKFYSCTGTLTAINTTSPNIQFVRVPDSEYFWLTGIYGSYFALAAPFTLADCFIQITNVFTQEQFFRTMPYNPTAGGAPRPGYANFQGVLEPGPIPNVITLANHRRLEGVLKPDTVLAPQQQLKIEVFGPQTFVQNIRFDILFIGMAARLLR